MLYYCIVYILVYLKAQKFSVEKIGKILAINTVPVMQLLYLILV